MKQNPAVQAEFLESRTAGLPLESKPDSTVHCLCFIILYSSFPSQHLTFIWEKNIAKILKSRSNVSKLGILHDF